MTDDALYALARRAGILVEWTDAADRPKRVAPEALRPILTALGFPCETAADIAQSREKLVAMEATSLPQMITADVDAPIRVSFSQETRGRLILENGSSHDVRLAQMAAGLELPPISQPGYHMLDLGDRTITIAVAPRRCFALADVAQNEKLWGLAVQLYGLRRNGDGGIGDTKALTTLARAAARHGADAIAISPVHAIFGARPDKFSPYSPSNRLFLNPLFADPTLLFAAQGPVPLDKAATLIDWPVAAAEKLDRLHRIFDGFWEQAKRAHDNRLVRDFQDFRQSGGVELESHACFEAIHAEIAARDPFASGWRDWPEEFTNPDNPAVRAFAAAHEYAIAFHIFLQWLIDRSLGAAQAEARAAGMRIGLIADLAIGMDSGGSYAWSHQQDILQHLSIGAPPDLFNLKGQDWGLTTSARHAFGSNGFQPFLATIRAAIRHSGGVRIDHILGLKRLWVIPEGATPGDGAYLSYPFDDLLRLVRLESSRHRAVIIGEDLGTVPPGFREKLSDSGIAGIDVLWFARAKDDFINPSQWRRDAVATTTTHDLPTVAGWWKSADIDFRAGHGSLDDGEDGRAIRDADRAALRRTMTSSGVASAGLEDAGAVVKAAVAFVATSPSPLLLLPLEDALGLEDQPNIPGTIDEHPNWRRRYPVAVENIFNDPAVLALTRVLKRRATS